MSSVDRLGMEFGQHVMQVTQELLMGKPGSLSEMERRLREALLRLGVWPKTRLFAPQWEIGPLPWPSSALGGAARPPRSRFWVQGGLPSRSALPEATFRLGF